MTGFAVFRPIMNRVPTFPFGLPTSNHFFSGPCSFHTRTLPRAERTPFCLSILFLFFSLSLAGADLLQDFLTGCPSALRPNSCVHEPGQRSCSRPILLLSSSFSLGWRGLRPPSCHRRPTFFPSGPLSWFGFPRCGPVFFSLGPPLPAASCLSFPVVRPEFLTTSLTLLALLLLL